MQKYNWNDIILSINMKAEMKKISASQKCDNFVNRVGPNRVTQPNSFLTGRPNLAEIGAGKNWLAS